MSQLNDESRLAYMAAMTCPSRASIVLYCVRTSNEYADEIFRRLPV